MLNPKPLAKIKQTIRGSEIIEFKDHNDEACTLQISDLLINYDAPGWSGVWLGRDEVSRSKVTGELLTPRMHLNRTQVEALVEHLKRWLAHGTFHISEET